MEIVVCIWFFCKTVLQWMLFSWHSHLIAVSIKTMLELEMKCVHSIERITAYDQLNGFIPPSILRLRIHRHFRLWYKLNIQCCDWRHAWVQLQKSVYTWVQFFIWLKLLLHLPSLAMNDAQKQRPSTGCGREPMNECFPPLLSSAVDTQNAWDYY